MVKYIKSHSNYRLQNRHQVTHDGIIFERDISTVGGVNTFVNGQATVYQSGNFVMVVNNGGSIARHVKKDEWLASGDDNYFWDENTLQGYSSDVNGSVEQSILLKNDFMDLRSFAYYGSLSDLIENTVSQILTEYPYELYINTSKTLSNEEKQAYHFEQIGDTGYTSGSTWIEISNPGNIDILSQTLVNATSAKLGYFCNGGVNNYKVYIESGDNLSEEDISSWTVNPSSKDCYSVGDFLGKIDISVPDTMEFSIFAFLDSERKIRYLLYYESNIVQKIHIRPSMNENFYEDFIDNLGLFGKCLMGIYSGVKNTARFVILEESEKGTSKSLQLFVFPTGEGEYNLATDGVLTMEYVQRLGRIGNFYDDNYTDNMYRMMTHDSLKNLDWTKGFNGDEGEDNYYIQTGQKFSSLIRVMGYVFDQEKAYIDSIGNVNTITYSNRSNLSDYFLTDSLETEGWMVSTIYPYKLTNWSEFMSDDTQRIFKEDTTITVQPYNNGPKAYYWACSGDNMTRFDISNEQYHGQLYEVSGDSVCNVFTDYTNDSVLDVPEVNNEFMKRFRINSPYILSRKGTIEGVESLLSLFGMKSKRWATAVDTTATNYDFDITEYTIYTPYITDIWDDKLKMYRMDWYNSCKTISYPTQSYIDGMYIPYQGLPVAYRDIKNEENDNERRLYPYFDNYGYYDGGMYYQMNGGWLDYYPYRYDVNGKKLNYSASQPTNVETIRNVMLVNNIDELFTQPMSELYNGIVYYINDITGEYALINNYPYPIQTEYYNGVLQRYFEVQIFGGTVSVGGDLYTDKLVVSDPHIQINGSENRKDYYLNHYEDGTVIRIYYIDYTFTIESYKKSNNEWLIQGQPNTAVLFKDGCKYREFSDSNGIIPPNSDSSWNVSKDTSWYDLHVYRYYDGTNNSYKAIFVNDEDGSTQTKTITAGQPFNSPVNGKVYMPTPNPTHYFTLDNIETANQLNGDCPESNQNSNEIIGWHPIFDNDEKYQRLEAIVDNYEGNNPHTGNLQYDNGEEYIDRFAHLFKYASENRYFDESCFIDYESAYDTINSYGFSGLESKGKLIRELDGHVIDKNPDDSWNVVERLGQYDAYYTYSDGSGKNYEALFINESSAVTQTITDGQSFKSLLTGKLIIGRLNIDDTKVHAFINKINKINPNYIIDGQGFVLPQNPDGSWNVSMGTSWYDQPRYTYYGEPNTLYQATFVDSESGSIQTMTIKGGQIFTSPVNGTVKIQYKPVNIYNIDSLESLKKVYSQAPLSNGDGEPSQIMNTKKINLTFYIHSELNSQAGEEEVKYIQGKIIPYVEQLLPSTGIITVIFQKKTANP